MKLSLPFRLLWLGQSLANWGDSLYILAVVTLIYQATGSVTLSALVPVFKLFPQLVSGLLAPLLLERFSLRSLLIISQAGQTVLLGSLAVLTVLIPSSSVVHGVLIFIGSIAFFDGWSTPARNALVPRLVEKKLLVKANSLLSTTDQTLMLLGWTCGGMLVAAWGPQPILWLTAAFFAVSTLSLLFIREPAQHEGNMEKNVRNWERIKEGWITLFSHPILKRVTLMDVLEHIAGTVWTGAIILAFVSRVLHKDETWWGFINGSYFAGTILGGLLIMALSKWIEQRLITALFFGSLCMAILTFAFAGTNIPIIALLLCLIMGPPYQAREIAQRTLFQTQTPPEQMPKVYAAHSTMSYAVFGLGVLGMGFLADHYPVQNVYIIAAILSGCSALIALALKRKHPSSEPEPVHYKKKRAS
ncbi:MFS transporter [Paenactinomyces guangxiensis]|uniref:MFS transporter n=1 Tax=Paenactinomyces guangxiensis TaxID=1490290 RepID=A0A7W2A708_9BACL|nr:MFS transporter [Paenactinomyces guangxiensis]MBA4493070.1 MFS transporter [Paenactinomyces guangxiensis]MBH8590080.1 MFS transporter [Paenactinomyces guangxiensis]